MTVVDFKPRWWGRVARSLLGASAVGLAAAALDASWAGAVQAEPPGTAQTWLADVGLIAPVALLVGAAVAIASIVFHPSAAPSLVRLSRTLAEGSAARRAELAALLPSAALATVLFLVLGARLALRLLAAEAPPAFVGCVLGAAAALLALGLGVLVVGVARTAGELWVRSPPDPRLTGGVGLVLSLLIFGWAIASGTTSGAGGVLDVFGVFKRPELDLRAPGLLAAIALGAYWLPAALRRVPVWAAFVAGVLPLAVLPFSAFRGLEERRVALAVERGAPLGRLSLAALRRATDRDRDGFSALFGGGDCDDGDPQRSPGVEDVPGNGIDEDCSGADDVLVALEKKAPAPPADARAAALAKLPEKLNVVLITIDTLRWDLGYAGNARPVSPNLDRLAKKSAIFERAYALASYTSKSLGPMLIGKYGSETHRGWSHFNRFDKADLFIQERLQRAGIRTLSVQGYWYFFQPGYGYERGFDVVDSEAAPKVVQIEGDRSFNSHKITDRAVAQLSNSENVGRQFYAWVHYIDPHTEYVRHEQFDFGEGSRERYDSEVRFVDEHVGRLIDFIEKSEFGPRTAIVVTSDHGEAFGEHGMIRHGFELWEELVRVPFVVYVPGAEPHRVSVRRSQIDLVPTLLDLYRLPKPSGEGTDFVTGESLLLDILRPPGYEPRARIVFIDMSAGPHNAERQAFIENDVKLVATSGRPLGLFDLATDPLEKKDLLDDKARAEEVLARFKAFRRQLREVKVRPTR